MVAALVVGGVLLAMMIAASGYAAVILPDDARIPLHLGSHQHAVLVSKRAGLVIWPAAGAVLYGILGGISREQPGLGLGARDAGRADTRGDGRGAGLPGGSAGTWRGGRTTLRSDKRVLEI